MMTYCRNRMGRLRLLLLSQFHLERDKYLLYTNDMSSLYSVRLRKYCSLLALIACGEASALWRRHVVSIELYVTRILQPLFHTADQKYSQLFLFSSFLSLSSNYVGQFRDQLATSISSNRHEKLDLLCNVLELRHLSYIM